MSQINYYSIILETLDTADKNITTKLVAEVFDIDNSIAVEIIQSCPITILENLEEAQLKNIMEELLPFSEAGLKLSAAHGTDTDIPKITWPEPPLVNGTSLLSYGIQKPTQSIQLKENDELFICPECGTQLQIQIIKTLTSDPSKKPEKAENKNEPDNQEKEDLEKYNIFVVNDQNPELKTRLKSIFKGTDEELAVKLQKKHIAIEKGVNKKKAIKIQKILKNLDLTPRITKSKN